MLTPEDKELVAPYVTNVDGPVFGFRNLSSETVGAMFGRYSRSPHGARELYLQEFAANEQRTQDFFKRVLVGFGDESVAELGETSLAVEGVSNVLVKLIEDRRIGISPLEKSTRYVRFNQKDEEGNYLYYRDSAIIGAGLGSMYERSMDGLFDAYTELIDPLTEQIKRRFPQGEGQTDGAYAAAIRSQACDVVRYLLPMSTKTNVGLMGNGRAFEYLLYKLRASGLAEGEQYAGLMLAELDKLIPAFMERPKDEKGQLQVDYLQEIGSIAAGLAEDTPDYLKMDEEGPVVRLMDYDPNGEAKVAAAVIFPQSNLPMGRLVQHMISHPDKVQAILEAIVAPRGNYRHKPPRGFEHTDYDFEIVSDIGAFRDMHRHRMCTQLRQAYTPVHGYSIPQDILDAGLTDVYRRAMDRAAEAHNTIQGQLPLQAQYAVPFGFYIRYTMRFNAREAYHLCELRSGVQGHPSYRIIAHDMAKSITKVHPTIGKGLKITWEGYDTLSRIASEVRNERRRAALEQQS